MRVVKVSLLNLLLLLAVTVQVRAALPEFTELVERASPAVVKINTVGEVKSGRPLGPQFDFPDGHPGIPDIFRELLQPRQSRPVQSMGSGFIISEDGYILTNNHVIESASKIQVRLSDRREYEAELIGADPRSDLALLKINEKSLPVLTLATHDSLKVGEWVLAIGSPFGLDFSASAGIVSAIGRSIPSGNNENYVPFIQTDVAINPGNSGGPLFNMAGEVVGINSQIYTRSGGSIGLSFAIPASLARDVVAQLKKSGRVERGWLGVVIQEVDGDLAKSFGLDKPSGALVAQVGSDSPAEQSGLLVGDVIVQFGAHKIHESSDLPHVVGRAVPGDIVEVVVIREGKQRVVPVTIGALGGDPEIAAGEQSDELGRLGMTVRPLPNELKKRLQLSGGVVVEQVAPAGAAAKAGIRPGDVIAQLGFSEVDSVGDFQRLAKELPGNSLLPIRFFRQGRAAFRTIMIEE
jgi:serine protease Do